ncbi:amidase family protein [Nocardia sp. NPDC060256]|uniref:amidase family protein n=1 Tax=Nocardia sp. NPDC060256 TaxID=3347086 RepID=UPI003667A736
MPTRPRPIRRHPPPHPRPRNPRTRPPQPTTPFDDLLDRLRTYVSFTPINNITGTPAITIPAGLTPTGLPIGIQFTSTQGNEHPLLELAYLIEAEHPFPRLNG